MRRSATCRNSPKRLSCFSRAMSAVGTDSMTLTSPASSAATRDAFCGSSRIVTRSHGVLPPHQPSKRASSIRSPLAKRTSLYGPVPLAALPELKSSVDAFSADFEMIAICVRSDGISG